MRAKLVNMGAAVVLVALGLMVLFDVGDVRSRFAASVRAIGTAYGGGQ